MTSPPPQLYAVKTYRYLRLAMVVLVLLLAATVVVERLAVEPGCFQTSISAYYYTPARNVFVAALVAIGVCLLVLKGNSEREDALLNLAGMLAPVVAFVPTPEPGSCSSSPAALTGRGADVANATTALLAVGLLAIVLTAVLASAERGPGEVGSRWETWLGIGSAAALWGGVTAVFAYGRQAFLDNAHYTAAIAMFACIIAVVVLNAYGLGQQAAAPGAAPPGRAYANRYLVLAVLMVVALGGMLVARALVDWAHAVLWIEGVLLSLFAVFWLLQTRELWGKGLR